MKCSHCGEGEGKKEVEEVIGEKMHKMKHEGKKRPHAQMIAIALSEARSKGFKIPKKPSA